MWLFLLFFASSIPSWAYTVTPIEPIVTPITDPNEINRPADECLFDGESVALTAAQYYAREHAEEDSIRKQAKLYPPIIERLKSLAGSGDPDTFSQMPGCTERRGEDLYLDQAGTHRLDTQGRDLVHICETYVIERAQEKYHELLQKLPAPGSVEMIQSDSICVGN